MINIEDKKQCCGCSACVQRCPKQCIVMKEDEEGFLYPFDDSYKMAFYIRKTFLEIEETKRRALRAKGHAALTHNRKKNAETLIEIYHKICTDNTINEKIEEKKNARYK